MSDDYERSRRSNEIPIEEILEANDTELLRIYIRNLSISFGQTIALRRYDLIEKELKKRTANLDIIENARNNSPEVTLLIGNYCGLLTLMKEALLANQTIQSSICLKAVQIKQQMKPTMDILNCLIKQPNATIEAIVKQTGQTEEEVNRHIASMITTSLVDRQDIKGELTYSITDTGRIYLNADNPDFCRLMAEDSMRRSADDWNIG